jgi:hypothetical protein
MQHFKPVVHENIIFETNEQIIKCSFLQQIMYHRNHHKYSYYRFLLYEFNHIGDFVSRNALFYFVLNVCPSSQGGSIIFHTRDFVYTQEKEKPRRYYGKGRGKGGGYCGGIGGIGGIGSYYDSYSYSGNGGYGEGYYG